MENNTCFIGKISKLNSIEGADKIVSAIISLNDVPITSVVVGKDDFVEGDLVAYFDSNLCLSEIAIETLDKNSPNFKDENFQSIGRYLARGNRVRTIKLRGTISDGLAIKANKLLPFFKSEKDYQKNVVEGFSFNSIDDVEICKKYIPSVKSQSISSGKKGKKKKLISRVIPSMFNFHIDTSQLLKNVHVLEPDQIISISSKWHGTSAICSYTKVLKKLRWYESALKKLGINIVDSQYDYLFASRTVVKNDLLNGTGFYSQNIWQDAAEKYFKDKLHVGETVYYEIVGYLSNGKMIQKPFDYGCAVNEYAIRVYRITLTSEDGTVSEYSWAAMKERCKELNVDMVIEYYYGKAKDMYPHILVDENWKYNFVAQLQTDFLEKDCVYCLTPKLPDEGIVLRIEGLYINVFKLKSKRFILKESELKEKEDFVDIESQMSDSEIESSEAQMPQKG